MRQILISNPSSLYITFLPYIHSLLKIYAMTDARVAASYDWLTPIYRHGNPDFLLQDYDLKAIDVLGLSCYVWNFPVQIELARRVKAANPHCLVVAGGPEPDWNDRAFFDKYPTIDLVVRHDGEIAFQKILLERLKGVDANYAGIPGVITTVRGQWFCNEKIEKPETWPEFSPYCDDAQMNDLVGSHPKGEELAAIWETNRGCPYSCVFCDWGSNVATKIRAFPQSKIDREIDWFSAKQIDRVYIADANFGILPRDEKIVDHVCESARNQGHPKVVDWCAAKNNIERITRITLKLHESGLNRGVLIGYQSTDAEVLKAMSRLNMAEERHRQMVEVLRKADVHIFGAIILGSPEDTHETFRNTIHDLLELGFHDSIRCYLYAILPNAPAASPEYLSRHSIRIKRSKIVGPVAHLSQLDSPYFPRMNYIVEHRRMSQKDWIRNCQYYGFISGLHNLGLTRYIALAVRRGLGIPFGELYGGMFDHFLNTPETVLGQRLRELDVHLQKFLTEDTGDFFIRCDGDGLLYEHEKWLFFKLLEDRHRFYSEVSQYLRSLLDCGQATDDLVKFQRFAILPDDPGFNLSQNFFYDWLNLLSRDKFNLRAPSTHFCRIERKTDPILRFPWLSSRDGKMRRHGYIREVLGSMIYKQSGALAELSDFTAQPYMATSPISMGLSL